MRSSSTNRWLVGQLGWRHYLSALSNVAASVAGLAEPAVEAYQSAWAERDASKRDDFIAKCWSPDAVFRDGTGYDEGREELADYIDAA